MKLNTLVDKYCTPALIYLALSVITLTIIVVQNLILGSSNELCVGSARCSFSHKVLALGLNVLYIAFWTWLLNYFCRKGLKSLSWFLLLLPFLISAVLIGIVFIAAASHPEQNVQNVKNLHHKLDQHN
tara:strand:- start:478 stop:861 length:384 start_codon:yes stop_codon:yes gene_type:complete